MTTGTDRPKYSRDELARLEASLRDLVAELEGHKAAGWTADLTAAADFLAETVGVLDRQRKAARDRAAAGIIEKRKSRPRRRRLRK